MRLLRTDDLVLESFFGRKIPEYAILSHTWDDDELLFEDIHHGKRTVCEGRQGFGKVQTACQQAQSDGFKYIWIDSCCIDKSSSAELSEAINSMFRWYRQSEVCYAYLSDVGTSDLEAMGKSRWFTRGWTLQELIAPDTVVFFDKNWERLDTRNELARRQLDDASSGTFFLTSVTKIPARILKRNESHVCLLSNRFGVTSWRSCIEDGRCRSCGEKDEVEAELAEYPVATRISWAADRQTTRREDMAYCLLGLFGASMPLLYGEGGTKAFRRLQEEVCKTTTDPSILAFMPPYSLKTMYDGDSHCGDLFAGAPSWFRQVPPLRFTHATSTMVENESSMRFAPNQLSLRTLLCSCTIRYAPQNINSSFPFPFGPDGGTCLAVLDCELATSHIDRLGILIRETRPKSGIYYRILPWLLLRIQPGGVKQLLGQGILESPYELVANLEACSFENIVLLTDPPQAKPKLHPTLAALRLRIDSCSIQLSDHFPQNDVVEEGTYYFTPRPTAHDSHSTAKPNLFCLLRLQRSPVHAFFLLIGTTLVPEALYRSRHCWLESPRGATDKLFDWENNVHWKVVPWMRFILDEEMQTWGFAYTDDDNPQIHVAMEAWLKKAEQLVPHLGDEGIGEGQSIVWEEPRDSDEPSFPVVFAFYRDMIGARIHLVEFLGRRMLELRVGDPERIRKYQAELLMKETNWMKEVVVDGD